MITDDLPIAKCIKYNIIISNCCLGMDIHRKLNKCEYNNPFIGTIIVDDFQ